MKEYPKLGQEFYKALIMGISMKMMRELRKHGKLKKD